MFDFLQELDLFLRIKFVIFVPSLLCLAVVAASEYLNYSQEGSQYKVPALVSVLGLLIYLVTDSLVSILAYIIGIRGLVTDIVGIVIGVLAVLLIRFAVLRHIKNSKTSERALPYKELEGCTGVITKSVRRSGSGVVAVRYNDKTVEAAVISEDSIPKGEKVRIIGSTREWLVCERDK